MRDATETGNMNRIEDSSRSDNNRSDKEGFKPWTKRSKIAKDGQSSSPILQENSPRPVQCNGAERSVPQSGTEGCRTGEIPKPDADDQSEGPSSASRPSDPAEGSVRIPEPIRLYPFAYSTALQLAYSPFDWQRGLGEHAPGAAGPSSLPYSGPTPCLGQYVSSGHPGQYSIPHSHSAPCLGQYKSDGRSANPYHGSRSWPGDIIEATPACWPVKASCPHPVPLADQGELDSADACESEATDRDAVRDDNSPDDDHVQHDQCPGSSCHVERQQLERVESQRIAIERRCPLNCDWERFLRAHVADEADLILPVVRAEQTQDVQNNADSLETQLDDEDQTELSEEIRSYLAELAIAASFQDLFVSVGGTVPLESGLRVYLAPSCLVRLADPHSDLFSFDHRLLYFDDCLTSPPFSYYDNSGTVFHGTRSFSPSTATDQPHGLIVHQIAEFLHTDPGQQIGSELSSNSSSPIVDCEFLATDPGQQHPRSEPVRHDDGPSKFGSLAQVAEQARRTPDALATSTDPYLTPVDDGSETESEREGIAAGKAERPPRKRKLEPADDKPEATSSTRRSKKIIEHVCELCGKTFARRFGLQMHWRTHSGERPYQCDVCQKCFAHQSHLNRHRRTHTGERNHFCFVCGRSFTENGSVVRHIKRRHPGMAAEIARRRTTTKQI